MRHDGRGDIPEALHDASGYAQMTVKQLQPRIAAQIEEIEILLRDQMRSKTFYDRLRSIRVTRQNRTCVAGGQTCRVSFPASSSTNAGAP